MKGEVANSTGPKPPRWVVLSLLGVGVLLGFASSGSGRPLRLDAETTVRVTLSDALLSLSPDVVPAGTVLFRVVNTATGPRDFVVAGEATRQIASGGTAALQVTLARATFYPVHSIGRRRARVLSSDIEVFAACANPVATSVSVRMAQDQGGIVLSQPSVPCGTVTFVVTDAGTHVDSFQVFGDLPGEKGSTPELQPGQSATIVVRFTGAGVAYYQSGDYPPAEPEFAGDYGEGGQFDVSASAP